MKYMILILPLMGMLTGCATFNDLLAALDEKPTRRAVTSTTTAPEGDSPRYSDTPQLGVPTDRQYKRMTRNRMEEESDLGASAGSTWVMEGQGAYLFAQNKMRKEGDLLNVKLDGPALKQVETKVSVIKKLLKQLEDEQERQRLEEQEALKNKLAKGEGGDRSPASEKTSDVPPVVSAAAPASPEGAKEEGLADVDIIPTRLIEKLADGNYRIKGQQPFMIGKREYKVIVTGLIRPEDFNDEGISSGKLLDPQYDVVSIRRNTRNE